MSPDWLLHDGKVIPSILVLSHAEQVDRLRLACPEAVPHSAVVGDLCFDRLLASKPLRPAYRQAFGLPTGAKLVVISSTWGPDSLLGEAPQIARSVAGSLPVDEFRVILALHPNIWARHSRWQVLEWLASCRRHGVYVAEDVDEWCAAIVAADLVIGDQGSVPFYSTALGNPLLLAAAPSHTVDPESPIAGLLSVAPKLDLSADIPEQLRAALAGHDPARYGDITALTTSKPGQAAILLRREMYRLLRLPEPSDPAEVVTVPLPERSVAGPDSHQVRVAVAQAGAPCVSRFPAERIRAGSAAAERGAHLAVGVREPLRRWLETADILLGESGPDVDEWITGTLALLPGCILAAAPAGPREWLIGNQTGDRRTVTGTPTACRVFVSVLYEWLSQGHGFDDVPPVWSIQLGEIQHHVTTSLCPPARRAGHGRSSPGR